MCPDMHAYVTVVLPVQKEIYVKENCVCKE